MKKSFLYAERADYVRPDRVESVLAIELFMVLFEFIWVDFHPYNVVYIIVCSSIPRAH